MLLRRVRRKKRQDLQPILEKQWKAFLSSLKPVTAKNYASSMRALAVHMQVDGARMAAARLLHAKRSARVLERWGAAMTAGGAAKATVQARLSGARAFLKYIAQHRVSAALAAALELRETLTEEDWKALDEARMR